MTEFSVLDLVPVREGGSVSEAFDAATDLARHAMQWTGSQAARPR